MNKSIKESQNVNIILNRLKMHYQLKNDADLARFLGVNPNTLAMHRKRGRLDYDKIIAVCADVDLNWVFRGNMVSEGAVTYADVPAVAPEVKSDLIAQLNVLKTMVERL